MKVLHRSPSNYLNWLYIQLLYLLNDSITGHVVHDQIKKMDQFFISNIHSVYQDSILRYYFKKKIRSKITSCHESSYFLSISKKLKADILRSYIGNVV